MRKNKIVSLTVPLLIVTLVGNNVLTPPSALNFIPYEVHKSLLSNTPIKEYQFIIGFDLVFLAILFILLNRTMLRILKR